MLADPGGRTWTWDEPGLAAHLAADLGRAGLELRRAPGAQHDLPGSVLVTSEATRAAVEAALGTPLDLRRFRTNLHLDLDSDPFAEESWEGEVIRFEGGVTLRLLHSCKRCVIPTRDPDDGSRRWPELLKWLAAERGGHFGINAEVIDPGVVRRAERVTLG